MAGIKPLVIARDPGCCGCVGLILLLPGTALALVIVAVEFSMPFPFRLQQTAAGFMAVLFVAFGILGLIRQEIVVDPRERKVVLQRRMLLTFARRVHRFADFSRLAIFKKETTSEGETTRTFPLVLQGDRAEIELETAIDYDAARRRADLIASLVGLPIFDESTGQTVRHGDYTQPLRERVRHGEASIVPAGSEPPTPIRVRRTSNQVIVEIPSRGDLKSASAALAAAVLFLAVPIYFVLYLPGVRRSTFDYAVSVIALGLFSAVTIAGVVGTIHSRGFQSERLVITSSRLQREYRTLFRKGRQEIPADTIAEVYAEPSLTILTTSGILSLAPGLDKPGREWLRLAIREIIGRG